MAPKHSHGDIVKFDNLLFEVYNIYAINWFHDTEPFVYGLVLYGSSPTEPVIGKQLIVREGLVTKATERDVYIWSVLYGKN